MKIQHDCFIKRRPIPRGVQSVRVYWKCPTCGEKWAITQFEFKYSANRLYPAGLKNRLWQRKARKEFKALTNKPRPKPRPLA